MKQRCATLESDVPRDSRMGRRISVVGELQAPPHSPIGYPEPPMPGKLQGFGGSAPDSYWSSTLHHTMTFSLSN